MVLEGRGRLLKVESSRTLIYVGQKVASDSAFPFDAGDALVVRIEGKGLRILRSEKGKARAPKAKP